MGVSEIAVAWIGFAGAVIAALIGGTVAWRQAGLSQRQAEMADRLARSQADTQRELAQLHSDLEAEQHRRDALFDRGLHAEDVLATYREPLAASAFDLQSRNYNILRLDFFDKWANGRGRTDAAIESTLFRLAQYFGWSEILRRKIQCDDTFGVHREWLRKEIAEPGVNDRLRDAQHLLCDLVETLDSRRVRYTQNLDRA